MYKVPHLKSSMVGHAEPWTGPSCVANSNIFFSLYSALLLSQGPLSHGVCVCRREVLGAISAEADLTPEELQGSRTVMEKKNKQPVFMWLTH